MSGEVDEIHIIAGSGLAMAHFGEHRSLHRERLGAFSSFERTPGSGITDLYNGGRLMLSYDESDKLNFIEMSGRASVWWDSVELTGQPLASVLSALGDKGVQVTFDDDATFEMSTLGIDLFTSAPDEGDEPVEGVSVHPISADVS